MTYDFASSTLTQTQDDGRCVAKRVYPFRYNSLHESGSVGQTDRQTDGRAYAITIASVRSDCALNAVVNIVTDLSREYIYNISVCGLHDDLYASRL